MTKEEAARLEHLGLTVRCPECAGKGRTEPFRSYEPQEGCHQCKARGWQLTATGEALVELLKSELGDQNG